MSAPGKVPEPRTPGRRARTDPADALGLQRLVDEFERERTDQQPVPSSITAAITRRPGEKTYAISAPTSSAEAPSAPHAKASST